MKKEGNRPNFRNAAKRAAFEYLKKQLSDAQRKLRDNRFDMQRLQKSQRELKADIAGLHQVMQEFKK